MGGPTRELGRYHQSGRRPLIRPGPFPTALSGSPTTTAPPLSRHAPCPATSPAGSSSGNCGSRVQPERQHRPGPGKPRSPEPRSRSHLRLSIL
jgi:hypothetical protein